MNALTSSITALALGLVAATSASAAISTTHLRVDISTTPYTIDFGSAGSVTFSTVDPTPFAYNPDGVETDGSVQVFSVGEPFYSVPTPTSFYAGRGGGLFPIGEPGLFASYSTPTAIPYSLGEGLIGLGITQSDGVHYALVDLDGSQVNGYAYATVAAEGLPYVAITPVPEPGAWVLAMAGLAGIGVMLRSARRRLSAAAA